MIGHPSAAGVIRYQQVIDGQDADIVDYLERLDRQSGAPCHSLVSETPGPPAYGSVVLARGCSQQRGDIRVPGSQGARSHSAYLATSQKPSERRDAARWKNRATSVAGRSIFWPLFTSDKA